MSTDTAFAQVLKNITFGSESVIMAGNFNVAYVHYSNEHPTIEQMINEQKASMYILKSLGLETTNVISSGNIQNGYGLSYDGAALTEKQQQELKEKLSKLSVHDINELSKEGVALGKMREANDNFESFSGNTGVAISAAKKFMQAYIEKTTVDLPDDGRFDGREDGGKTSQLELNRIYLMAQKYGATLKINNVEGDNDSITTEYADGSSITQKVVFSNDKVKVPTPQR